MKEAVTNIVKHSGTTTCTIAIEPSLTELVIRVKDNGIGMGKNRIYSRVMDLRDERAA